MTDDHRYEVSVSGGGRSLRLKGVEASELCFRSVVPFDTGVVITAPDGELADRLREISVGSHFSLVDGGHTNRLTVQTIEPFGPGGIKVTGRQAGKDNGSLL